MASRSAEPPRGGKTGKDGSPSAELAGRWNFSVREGVIRYDSLSRKFAEAKVTTNEKFFISSADGPLGRFVYEETST